MNYINKMLDILTTWDTSVHENVMDKGFTFSCIVNLRPTTVTVCVSLIFENLK